jgi:hypothetical protein
VPWNEPGSTAIVVLTREAEPVVGSIYGEHSQAGRDGMIPHVTLVIPFVPAAAIDDGIDYRLRSLFGSFASFDYRLRQLESFESGVLYLPPEPTRPFVELVSALVEEFPEHLPYEGIHDEVIPHVTVAVSEDDALLERIRAEVAPGLPIRCRAEEATLVERDTDLRWNPAASFALGSLE